MFSQVNVAAKALCRETGGSTWTSTPGIFSRSLCHAGETLTCPTAGGQEKCTGIFGDDVTRLTRCCLVLTL
jgi:hypothetical protein